MSHHPEPELRACADQLSGWTCTLLAGPHPERKHWDENAGRWWAQASDAPNTVSVGLGQPDGSQP
ncbi:hypothetical protein GT352_28045 [Streptomyces sp. SID1046]|uniref:hypothetical protein n=1 Tax=Streptomyces sp. SID1046 TaxID=2690249 RepID=UPI00136F99BB|nr:hypothetical protein [Streptomyces sp. SID1046]MYV77753.1 hypothetical protein [Streptomyces sp. SID1046]